MLCWLASDGLLFLGKRVEQFAFDEESENSGDAWDLPLATRR